MFLDGNGLEIVCEGQPDTQGVVAVVVVDETFAIPVKVLRIAPQSVVDGEAPIDFESALAEA